MDNKVKSSLCQNWEIRPGLRSLLQYTGLNEHTWQKEYKKVELKEKWKNYDHNNNSLKTLPIVRMRVWGCTQIGDEIDRKQMKRTEKQLS